MENLALLEKYGLFDAKVPRYTSYPPANHFEAGIGQRNQSQWLAQIEPTEPLSLYVHIPFCRRLCWFCACRTQGTKTLRPVEDYVDILMREIDAVSFQLERQRDIARLHLGGGTPTLLSATAMNKLLTSIFDNFSQTADFEFSVEIDPTEASDDILSTLTKWGMDRASIGVQDFYPAVQEAIGREQSFEDTKRVVDILRGASLKSLNMDLLYGLPHQTEPTIRRTLEDIKSLSPDRLALYGYAHVPHISKRQVMIPTDDLPDPRQRFKLAEIAQTMLSDSGYVMLGIDHFAKPDDGLAQAAAAGTMKRNFQGYTDDPCDTLIGFGASAISKFRQGYSQNAVATAAYVERVQASGMAGHRGYAMSPRDDFLADMIEDLMCKGAINLDDLAAKHYKSGIDIRTVGHDLLTRFPDALTYQDNTLTLSAEAQSLCRVVAAAMDESLSADNVHSLAI
ncbi:MAG: oxygen-independent coproporphyrinogen III oxidase [Pseudomonadota bacterium]